MLALGDVARSVDSLTATFGSDLDGTFGTAPGSDNEGGASFAEMATAAGIDGTGVYVGESADAAALLLLAMAAARSMRAGTDCSRQNRNGRQRAG